MYKNLAKTLQPEFVSWVIANHYDSIAAFYNGYIDQFLEKNVGELTPQAKREVSKHMLKELVDKWTDSQFILVLPF